MNGKVLRVIIVGKCAVGRARTAENLRSPSLSPLIYQTDYGPTTLFTARVLLFALNETVRRKAIDLGKLKGEKGAEVNGHVEEMPGMANDGLSFHLEKPFESEFTAISITRSEVAPQTDRRTAAPERSSEGIQFFYALRQSRPSMVAPCARRDYIR